MSYVDGRGYADVPRDHVWIGHRVTICGLFLPLAYGDLTTWMNRHDAPCPTCQVLVAICDANGIGPDSEPSLRGALERFLREKT